MNNYVSSIWVNALYNADLLLQVDTFNLLPITLFCPNVSDICVNYEPTSNLTRRCVDSVVENIIAGY